MGKARFAPLVDRQAETPCYSKNVVDIQKIRYCIHSANCAECGDRRLLIIERIIDGDYSDETLDKIIVWLTSVNS